MKSYRLLVARKVTMTAYAVVEAESEEDARAKYEHLRENNSDFGISEEEWGEAYYYQVVKAGPSSGEFELLDLEEEK
jgi:hypothetical protein